MEIMKRKLELVVWPKLRKSIEFKQSLDCLYEILKDYCSSLRIEESENGNIFTLTASWETSGQMRHMFQSKEFMILSGAIAALSEKTEIRLDDKEAGEEISILMTL